MGLLLSVLVVCVGVLEVIACVRHFQDGYLPLWTPHCAVTSGFAITHDRWRKLPSFDYAKNDDEKHFEDLTGAKNGTVTLGLQDGCVESVEKFGKTLHCDASLQDDQKVVSEVNLQESEATFVAQKLSDSVASANEPEDKIVNFTSDIHKQTVTDVFQSDIYNNNLVQTEHNLEEVITFHTQDSSITSEQDIQTNCEAPDKKAELIQQPPKDIPDDSLKHVEENEDNDTHETTVVGTPHHEETTHITEDNDFESDSRLEPQTSSSDAEVIRSADIDTQPQDEPDAEVKSEETPEELIETLKKTPSPVRISPPISTPPLTPKKSKADISWPTFFPGAPVIKRPSVSFATPEALLAGEDPEPRLRNDEEERPATPPPIIKRSKENTPVPSDVESRSISSESLGEDVDQEEEDNEDQSLFSGIRDKSPTSIISGNDFSKKELELQRRKSYKLKRFNSAVETVSRDEQTEDRSFSEDKKGVSHAVKSREPKRKLKKPVKATSFEDAMLRDIRDGDVVEGGTTLKLGKEVKFVDEPAVVAEEEEILLEQEAQTPQEESKLKTDEGLKVSFGQVELEPEKFVVDDEESQFEKNHFAEQKEQVISEQKIFDDSEDIQASPDERLKEELNQEQCSAVRKPADENQDGVINQIKDDEVPKTESGGQSNKEDEIHQHVLGEKSMGMQNTSQVHSKSIEVKSSEELTTRIDSKQSEERKDDVPSPKEVETLKNNSEMHSKSTQSKSSDQSTTKFDSNQSEEKLGDKQLSKEEEEEEEEEEIVEWIEEEIILDDSEVPSRAMENNRSNEISTKLDPRQNEEKSHTKQVVAEEQEEEEVEEEEEEIEEEEEEEAMIVNNSKVHSKAVEIKSSDEMSTKTGTKQDEEEGKGYQRVTEEVEEEELVEEEEQKLEQEPIVVLDKSKVHSKAIEIKSSDEMSTKTGTKQDEEEGNGNQRVTEEVEEEEEEELVEEEEQELEQEPIVVLDKSKVHSKAIEIKSSDEMSIKTDSKQDDRKGETKSADAEQEKDVVMVDNSEVHSKAVKIKTNEEISNKTKQHGEELVIDASKVHSKPAETKSSDETTTKVLAREPEEEDEGLGIEEKTSAMKVSDEQEKGLTREEKCSTMKVCDEGQQQRQSGVRFAEPEREEEEDSSSYTLSESTQQKTPPKEAFWME